MFASAALAASSCTKRHDRGVPMREVQIEAAKSARTKADVRAALGSPAATTIAGDKWFYFHAEGRVFAFFDPYFKEYKVLAIEFGEGDKVREVAVRDISGASFEFDSRSTTSAEVESGFFTELFGNVGSVQMGGMGPSAGGGE